MRWLMSLFFVLALGLMGCSETTGNGGNGGTGGVGGDGGTGGDPVTDCRSQADGASCLLGETAGRCYADKCRVTDCSDLSTGTPCWLVSVDPPRGFCEGGDCRDAVSDCTGVEVFTPCTGETTSYCAGDVCYPQDCTGLEDGTECIDDNPLNGISILICGGGICGGQ